MIDPIEKITNNLDKSYSITASAGCGKTYALVSRVIALLKIGISINRLLLLTFSENAALEMKERIIDELKKNRTQQWAMSALDEIHYSPISTFHSFALEICKSFPQNLGINSQVSLLDETNNEKNQIQFFNKVFNSWGLESTLINFITLSYLNGIKRKDWKCFFSNIYDNLEFDESISAEEEIASEIVKYEKVIDKSFTNIKKQAKFITNEFKLIDKEKISDRDIDRYTRFNSFAQAISHCENTIDLFVVVNNKTKYLKTRKFESKKKKCSLDEYIESMGETIDSSLREIADSTLSLGTKLLVEAALKYRKESITQGVLTFNDVILGAKYILQNESNNYEIWKKYDSIIIDEFQDTDPHQLDIVKALCSNASEDDIGRLFVVGDHKQSIYGFRGVDVDKYKNFVDSVHLDKVQLFVSRRTTKNIVENVNSIMSNMIVDYDEMKHIRDDFVPLSHPHFSTIGGGINASNQEIRKQQANDIANSIQKLKNVEIYDQSTDQFMHASYKDITILIRDRSILSNILIALKDNNIPFSVDSPALIFEHPFMKLILIYLKAISQPSNSINVIGALRSPLFRCTNNDLLDFIEFIKLNNPNNFPIDNYWDLKAISNVNFDLASKSVLKIRESLNQLDKLHKESNMTDLISFLVKLLLNNGAALGICNSSSIDISEISDITKVIIAKAIAFTKSPGTNSIHDFVAQLDDEKNKSRSSDKIALDSKKDEVHIMTAHSSKGLEFPIVIYVPSIKRNNSTRGSKTFILKEQNDSFVNSIALFQSSKFKDSRLDVILEEKKYTEIDEETRIAYVGLTRARDYLVVAKHHKLSKNKKAVDSSAAKLAQAIEQSEICDSKIVNKNSNLKNELASTIDENEKENIVNIVSAAHLRKKVEELHIAIESNRTQSPGNHDIIVSQNSKTFSTHRDLSLGPALGRAVHRSLYLIDFKNDDQHIQDICKTCAYQEGIATHINVIVDNVKKALETKLISNLSSNHYREVPVSGIISGIKYSGFIDLLIEENGVYNIVDYKTDLINAQNPIESKIEKYSKQLAIYSLLLKQNENILNTKATILFLSLDENIEYKISNLDEIYKEILA